MNANTMSSTGRRTSSVLAWAAVLLVVIVHVRYYRSVSKRELDIVQASVSNPALHGLLDERSLIVIEESIVDMDDFVRKLFKYRYVSSHKDSHNNSHKDSHKHATAAWTLAVGRYTLLYYSSAEDAGVDVIHPFSPCNVVRIKLARDQVVILPPRYRYRPSTDSPGQLKSITLHDWLSLALRPFAYLLLTYRECKPGKNKT